MSSSRSARRLSPPRRAQMKTQPAAGALRSSARPSTRRLLLSSMALALVSASASTTARADVTATSATAGVHVSSPNAGVTQIVAPDNAIINYAEFNVAGGESVTFVQPSADARVLNRIHSASPSVIDGTLSANGSVYLVNPAGVTFGNGAVVNVGSLYAAAGNLSDADFLSGVNRFTDLSGAVQNHGTIHAHSLVALIGRDVSHGGTISAPAGTVVMAAGDSVLIGQVRGNVFVSVQTGPGADADAGGIDVSGHVQAPEVSLASGDIYSMAVSGWVDASSADGEGGDITVTGRTVELTGTLDASGATAGGTIHVGGEVQGTGDTPTAQRTYVGPQATLRAAATEAGDGGTVVVWADEATWYYGTIDASAGPAAGNGGFVEVSGKTFLAFAGDVDASALAGEAGTILLDPENIVVINGGPGTHDGLVADGSILAGDNPGETLFISEQALEALSGNIVLEATNDITIEFITDQELDLRGADSLRLIADSDQDGSGSLRMNSTFSGGPFDNQNDVNQFANDNLEFILLDGVPATFSGSDVRLSRIRNIGTNSAGTIDIEASADLSFFDIQASGNVSVSSGSDIGGIYSGDGSIGFFTEFATAANQVDADDIVSRLNDGELVQGIQLDVPFEQVTNPDFNTSTGELELGISFSFPGISFPGIIIESPGPDNQTATIVAGQNFDVRLDGEFAMVNFSGTIAGGGAVVGDGGNSIGWGTTEIANGELTVSGRLPGEDFNFTTGGWDTLTLDGAAVANGGALMVTGNSDAVVVAENGVSTSTAFLMVDNTGGMLTVNSVETTGGGPDDAGQFYTADQIFLNSTYTTNTGDFEVTGATFLGDGIDTDTMTMVDTDGGDVMFNSTVVNNPDNLADGGPNIRKGLMIDAGAGGVGFGDHVGGEFNGQLNSISFEEFDRQEEIGESTPGSLESLYVVGGGITLENTRSISTTGEQTYMSSSGDFMMGDGATLFAASSMIEAQSVTIANIVNRGPGGDIILRSTNGDLVINGAIDGIPGQLAAAGVPRADVPSIQLSESSGDQIILNGRIFSGFRGDDIPFAEIDGNFIITEGSTIQSSAGLGLLTAQSGDFIADGTLFLTGLQIGGEAENTEAGRVRLAGKIAADLGELVDINVISASDVEVSSRLISVDSLTAERNQLSLVSRGQDFTLLNMESPTEPFVFGADLLDIDHQGDVTIPIPIAVNPDENSRQFEGQVYRIRGRNIAVDSLLTDGLDITLAPQPGGTLTFSGESVLDAGTGDIIIGADRINAPEGATIFKETDGDIFLLTNGGNVIILPNERVFIQNGDLVIKTGTGNVQLADVVVAGGMLDIRTNEAIVDGETRTFAFDDTDGNILILRRDDNAPTSVLARDGINLVARDITAQDANIRPIIATQNGEVVLDPAGSAGNFDVRRVQTLPTFEGEGLILDELVTDVQDPATALAGESGDLANFRLTRRLILSEADLEVLQKIVPGARQLTSDERVETTQGRAFYDDMIDLNEVRNVTLEDYRVVITRMDPDAVVSAIETYRAVLLAGEESRKPEISEQLGNAVFAYTNAGHAIDGEEYDPAAFRRFINSELGNDQLVADLDQLERLLSQIGRMGLNDVEEERSYMQVLDKLPPNGLSLAKTRSLLLAQSVEGTDPAPAVPNAPEAPAQEPEETAHANDPQATLVGG